LLKISVTINSAEIVFDAQTQEEILSAGTLLKELVGLMPPGAKGARAIRQGRQTTGESELFEKRASAIDFILDTSRFPMNAREIANQVKDVDAFYTKNGDPVHIVRRILASNERFEKTISGLFTLKDKSEQLDEDATPVNEDIEDVPRQTPFARPVTSGSRNYHPPANDDMDDPFADS